MSIGLSKCPGKGASKLHVVRSAGPCPTPSPPASTKQMNVFFMLKLNVQVFQLIVGKQ